MFVRGQPEQLGLSVETEHQADVVALLWANLELFRDATDGADTASVSRPHPLFSISSRRPARVHSSAPRRHAEEAAARPATAGAARVHYANADPPVPAFRVDQHLDHQPGARQAGRGGVTKEGAFSTLHVSPARRTLAD